MQQYVCRRKLESIASRTKHTNKFGELTARPLVVLVVVFFQVESYSVISFHTFAKKMAEFRKFEFGQVRASWGNDSVCVVELIFLLIRGFFSGSGGYYLLSRK